MPERYEDWSAERRLARLRRPIDFNPEPPKWADVDLSELRDFVERTGYRGQSALENYALEKVEREQRKSHDKEMC